MYDEMHMKVLEPNILKYLFVYEIVNVWEDCWAAQLYDIVHVALVQEVD